MSAKRSTKEAFYHHVQAVQSENLDDIVADFHEDAVFLTPGRVRRGRDGVREAFAELLGAMPHATWETRSLTFADDVVLAQWSAQGGDNRVDDGVDTIVFRDGLITVHSVCYTMRPAR
jgi:ketosteroid isomerase-like protein